MLIGQYEGKVSVKFQISFPKKFREELGNKLIVTKGFEKTLLVIAEANWKTVLMDIENSSLTQASSRETKRFLYGGATDVELDGKGRFIIPEYLRNFAELGEDIIFVGQESYAEIWNKKRWEDYNESLIPKISEIAEKLTVRKETRDE